MSPWLPQTGPDHRFIFKDSKLSKIWIIDNDENLHLQWIHIFKAFCIWSSAVAGSGNIWNWHCSCNRWNQLIKHFTLFFFYLNSLIKLNAIVDMKQWQNRNSKAKDLLYFMRNEEKMCFIFLFFSSFNCIMELKQDWSGSNRERGTIEYRIRRDLCWDIQKKIEA